SDHRHAASRERCCPSRRSAADVRRLRSAPSAESASRETGADRSYSSSSSTGPAGGTCESTREPGDPPTPCSLHTESSARTVCLHSTLPSPPLCRRPPPYTPP